MRDYENSTEPELIRWAKQGDVDAFSRLYAGIYKDLYRFALYTVRHRQDAEDAVSEAVAAAWENIGQLRKEESFRAWIFTILNNCCRKILRRQRKDVVSLTDSIQQGSAQGNGSGVQEVSGNMRTAPGGMQTRIMRKSLMCARHSEHWRKRNA